MRCGRCGQALRPEDVDPESLQASCSACGWVFGQPTTPFRQRAVPAEEAGTAASPIVPDEGTLGPPPPGITSLGRRGDPPHLIVEDPSPATVAFTAVVIGGLVAALFIADLPTRTALGLLALLSPSLYFAVFAAARRAHIEIRQGELVAHYGRWPWPATRIPLASLEQLYLERYGRKNTFDYHVIAIHGGGRKTVLLNRLTDAAAARYVERRIERYAGLDDLPVSGEFDHYDRRPVAPRDR